MRAAAPGPAIDEPSYAVINTGDPFMKRKLFLAIAILLVAGFRFGWQESPRAVGGATAEVHYAAKAPGALTFDKDIAPIIFDNCASCHRPGAVAPFSLLSYQ